MATHTVYSSYGSERLLAKGHDTVELGDLLRHLPLVAGPAPPRNAHLTPKRAEIKSLIKAVRNAAKAEGWGVTETVRVGTYMRTKDVIHRFVPLADACDWLCAHLPPASAALVAAFDWDALARDVWEHVREPIEYEIAELTRRKREREAELEQYPAPVKRRRIDQ